MKTNEKAEQFFQKAILFHKKGREIKAIEECNKSIKESLNPKAFFLLGEIYLIQGNIKEAEKQYRNSIMSDINYVPAYNSLATLKILIGDLNSAKIFLESALDRKSNNQDVADTYFNLASISQLEGNLLRAAKYFKKTLDLNPDHKEVKNLLQALSGSKS